VTDPNALPRATAPSSRTAGVAFIVIVLLLDTLGIGLIIPVLPSFLASFVHGDLADASRFYGVLVSIYAGMQFVFAPVLGALSDRFGRRGVIFASLLGAGINYVLTAFAPSLPWLFAGRVVAGITGASFSAATAYIADVTPPAKRAQGFGVIGAALGVGFIVGPAVGGLLARFDMRAPFLCAAALNLLNLAYGVFVLPESLRREDRRPFSFARANPFGAFAAFARGPVMLGLTGTIMCGYLAQWILQATWALYTQQRFGWTPFDVGLSLTVVGVSSAIVQGGLVRAILPKLGERRALLVGMTLSIVGFMSFALATHAWILYATIFPFALGGIAGPAIQAMLSREVLASEQGELQGSLVSLQSVAAILGPLMGTRLFSRFAPESAVPHVPGAAFFAAAALNVVGLLLAARLFARVPEQRAAS
jgi:DHA1 family tetracycline resistance protein-like MFS transporter